MALIVLLVLMIAVHPAGKEPLASIRTSCVSMNGTLARLDTRWIIEFSRRGASCHAPVDDDALRVWRQQRDGKVEALSVAVELCLKIVGWVLSEAGVLT